MKPRSALVISASLLAILAAAVVVGAASPWTLEHQRPPLPPTPGPPPTPVQDVGTTRGEAVINRDEAIQRALFLDSQGTIRERPLTKETIAANPEMVVVEPYATRQEAADTYWGDGFGDPEIASESVWVVAIKGEVSVMMIGQGFVEADGVTYVISQKDGKLLRVVTGIPRKRNDKE